jgi:hypothetical protein
VKKFLAIERYEKKADEKRATKVNKQGPERKAVAEVIIEDARDQVADH